MHLKLRLLLQLQLLAHSVLLRLVLQLLIHSVSLKLLLQVQAHSVLLRPEPQLLAHSVPLQFRTHTPHNCLFQKSLHLHLAAHGDLLLQLFLNVDLALPPHPPLS